MRGKDTWGDLTYFQSVDLVRREYKEWHGAALSDERSWEIVSAFIQGREYFLSASTAADVVRPLLLYYAILAVSRGLIIFIGKKSEATLKGSHGLEATGWEETLKAVGKGILDLKVSISDGTFAELAAAVGGSVAIQLDKPDGSGVLFFKHTELGDSGQRQFELRDVLSREPALRSLYSEVTRAHPYAWPGNLIDLGHELQVSVLCDAVVGLTRSEMVRSIFAVPAEVALVFDPTGFNGLPALVYRLPHSEGGPHPQACPVVEHVADDRSYLIAPWANGGHLTPLLRCFVQAYTLGMLCRYFPSKWMKLIRGQRGDAEFPLLQRTVDHLQEAFPALVRAELRHFGK